MRCIVVLMSQTSNSATTEALSVTSIPNRKPMLAGYPWVSAIILYTLSWGWSLLRPNTLYWDDWAIYFDRPADYGLKYASDMGRAPWGGLIEFYLQQVGIWAVSLATFAIFFATSLLIFIILFQKTYLADIQVRIITIVFLTVPVNHARIAVTIFDYTTSYFLFFLGWLILIRHRSLRSFILSWVILFLSLKTHSFLFFILLPFLHFYWLNNEKLLKAKKLNSVHLQFVLIALMPFLYLILRDIFWSPSEAWVGYHRPSVKGFLMGSVLFALPIVVLVFYTLRTKKKMQIDKNLALFSVGIAIIGLALLPYFAGGLYKNYFAVIAFRADWGSRHQLLMPLGLALSVVGLNERFNKRKKNIVFIATVALSVALNMFWGSQYFVMSHKQEQLVELFKTTEGKVKIASVEDQTKRFNGRESTFRGYEWNGFMTLAGISTDRLGCEALPSGSALILNSDTPYLKALVTRDLGLYFEVTPCSEVLAKDS